MRLLIRHVRKYHLFHEFKRLNLQTNAMAAVRDKNKIDGAYLLMKRFKNRLKAFDSALQAIEKAKVNTADFERLKATLDSANSQSIFRDVIRLFDTAKENFEHKIEKEMSKTTASFEKLLAD